MSTRETGILDAPKRRSRPIRKTQGRIPFHTPGLFQHCMVAGRMEIRWRAKTEDVVGSCNEKSVCCVERE